MIFDHAIKFGDALCIRACHKIFAVFFYAHKGNSSKYSPSLMNSLLDYEASSEKERMMIDLFSSINCYGKNGLGVPADMVNEWAVKSVKSVYEKHATNYEARTFILFIFSITNIVGNP